nr:RecName: Full=Unknown protein CP 39 from 2D-PAGE [Clostridium pasteurianum]
MIYSTEVVNMNM